MCHRSVNLSQQQLGHWLVPKRNFVGGGGKFEKRHPNFSVYRTSHEKKFVFFVKYKISFDLQKKKNSNNNLSPIKYSNKNYIVFFEETKLRHSKQMGGKRGVLLEQLKLNLIPHTHTHTHTRTDLNTRSTYQN